MSCESAPTCEALRRLAAAGRIDPATAATSDRRLSLSAPARAPAADGRRRANPSRSRPIARGSQRIAVFLGYPQTEAFVADLTSHLGSVERHYAELFEQAPSLAGPGNLVFTGVEDDPATLETLSRLGFADPAAVAALVRSWHHGRLRATRSQRAREILTELVPELLRVFGASAQPDAALLRFDQFLSHLPAGVQLFSLFHANPGLLALVAEIMAGAPLLAEQLAQRPQLLDSVLTEEFFAAAARAWTNSPPISVASAPPAHNYEDCLDAARRWAGERRFQVGVQLLRRALDEIAAGARARRYRRSGARVAAAGGRGRNSRAATAASRAVLWPSSAWAGSAAAR